MSAPFDSLTPQPITASPPAPAAGATTTPATRARRRRWWLVLAVLFVFLLFVLRAPLLRLAAGCLTYEDAEAASDALVVIGSEDCSHEAARLYRAERAPVLLLIEAMPDRLVASGVVRPETTRRRDLLVQQGVPADAIQVLPGQAMNHGQAAAALRPWLENHASQQVCIVCDQFDSRKTSCIYRRVLGSALAARVAWHPVRHRDHDETNWWKTRGGVQAFFYHASALAYVVVHGEDTDPTPPCTADEYERIVCPSLP